MSGIEPWRDFPAFVHGISGWLRFTVAAIGRGGQYCLHDPICVRRVLSDETLISPACPDDSTAAASSDDWYAITFTNYHRGKARQPFDGLAEFLTVTMGRLFRARPHWGRICPDNLSGTMRLYPRMWRFLQICQRIDPDGAFRNQWISSLLEEG